MCDPRENYKKVTHCIFDIDGLLLDSERIYAEALQELLEPYGHTYTNDMRMQCMSLTGSEICQKVVEHYKLPITAEELRTKHHAIVSTRFADVELMPGAERLLRHLDSYRIPMAVATSSSEKMYKAKLTKHRKLFKVFHHMVCGAFDPEVKHGKPAPDIYLIAAARFPDKPKPESCLAFEDSPNGLKAALSAGMQVIMVPESFVPCELSEGATQRLNSLECFQPQDFGLPAYRIQNRC